MRRALLTASSTAAGVALLLSLKPHHHAPPAAAVHPPAAGPATPSAGAATRSGTFTGKAVDTQYGPVQVAATLKQGKLTAVKILQVPSGSGRDQEITAFAVPQLNQEALSAQSAHIDAVSGASYTSGGYIDSLQSALDKAGAR